MRERSEWQAFEKSMTDSIVARVQAERNARGWTTGELVERIHLAGWPVQRTTFLNLLASRRQSLGTAEIAAMATALEVPVTAIAPELSEEPDFLAQFEARAFNVARMVLVHRLLYEVNS